MLRRRHVFNVYPLYIYLDVKQILIISHILPITKSALLHSRYLKQRQQPGHISLKLNLPNIHDTTKLTFPSPREVI